MTDKAANLADKPKPRIDLLYFGVAEGQDVPLLHLWYDLTGIANDGQRLQRGPHREQRYGTKKRGGARNIAFASAGQIYSFEKSEHGVFSGTARYVGRWQ